MTRVRDPELMRELHEKWNEFGCAICGERPVEVHHTRSRAQQGPDSVGNAWGLCGEFSKKRHHAALTANRVVIGQNHWGQWVWTDKTTQEAGLLRVPEWFPALVASGSEAGADVSASVSIVAPPSPTLGVPVGAESPLPPLGAAPSTPGERFNYLRGLARASTRALLEMSVLLRAVKASGEWQQLGFESFQDYFGEAGLGLASGTVSKMLRVAAFYEAQWPRALEIGVSLERLYMAARVEDEPELALVAAEAEPAYVLAERAKGTPASQEAVELCEACGQRIRRTA